MTHDPAETQEWVQAWQSFIEQNGNESAGELAKMLWAQLSLRDTSPTALLTPYLNTIPHIEKAILSDEEKQAAEDLLNIIRWNAIAMVIRAGRFAPELGGHIASFASIALLYETGMNYFFHTESENHGGDLVLFQGHSSPGIYSRAFLEGRLSKDQLNRFRQEIGGPGLSSYPHPWLMPDFWQFPTVSMGLGAMQAIYNARFLKYLGARGLCDTENRHVWCFCGDGEMDEPESLGAITVAGRESLDNLILVINCNLQRLDGPVRGNSKIVQEFEGVFRGAGWHVIKALWGESWETLLNKDKTGLLAKRMAEIVDGDYQNFVTQPGRVIREEFFGKSPELLELVSDMSDSDLEQLQFDRGGHDMDAVYSAYDAATKHKGQPVVILAKTVKGYGMGKVGEGQNTTHQQKKLTNDQLKWIRDRFSVPLTDEQVENVEYCTLDENSTAMKFLKKQREALGGPFPSRRRESDIKLTLPKLDAFKPLLESSGDREISSTMAFVRILGTLLKDKGMGKHVVPIVPDESRTFGMEGMFRQFGIYSPLGQLYTPVDAKQVMYYKEDKKGQVLQEGINELGAMSSWLAAATSYSNSNMPMVPFYIYYSMFGFQRVGDMCWAAGDSRARGFIVGGTAGRTTLAGEGLQHQDGHSHIMANTIPNCRSYDPTYGYELAVIIQYGLERMYGDTPHDEYYYLSVMNENYHHPAMPEGVEEGIIKGMYPLKSADKHPHTVELLGCGTILNEVVAAAEFLAEHFDVGANVWSVTSFNELQRDGADCERDNRLADASRTPYITECLKDANGPVIAASDYIRSYAEQVRAYIPHDYHVLGTDGFGRSDTRKQLRHFFEVDRDHIVYTALYALVKQDKISKDQLDKAKELLTINTNHPNPIEV